MPEAIKLREKLACLSENVPPCLTAGLNGRQPADSALSFPNNRGA